MTEERQPWHYDVFEGRPEWSKQLARRNIIQIQQQRDAAGGRAQREEPPTRLPVAEEVSQSD